MSDRVVELTSEDAGAAGRVGAAAFDNDPLFSVLWPRPVHRSKTLRSVLRAEALIAAEKDSGGAAVVDGAVAGIALWARPGVKRTPRQNLREALGGLRALGEPPTLVPGVRVLMALEKRRPKEPHHYLGVLAVDPAAQGRGIGHQLIEEGLALSDSEGVPTFLETAKDANLAWYSRFGFEVTEELRPHDSLPPIWTMTRPPRP